MKKKLIMRSLFVRAAFSLMVLTISVYGVRGQPTEQFPLWGTCGETSKNGLTAITSFQSAVPIVLGLPAPTVDCKIITLWKNAIPGERTGTNKGAGSVWGGGLRGWPDDPVTFLQAVAFLKTILARKEGDQGPVLSTYGTTAISNAYLEVYGRPATAADLAVWEPQVKAQKAWYATIAFAEIKKLNSTEKLRQKMLDRAFEYSTGRMASDADLAYWLPRSDHYRLVVAAARTWLYAPGSAEELKLAIARAYKAQYGKAATATEVASRVTSFSAMKPQPLFDGMMK